VEVLVPFKDRKRGGRKERTKGTGSKEKGEGEKEQN